MKWCCAAAAATASTPLIADVRPNQVLHTQQPTMGGDQFGPMLIRPMRTALVISSTGAAPECPFIERMRAGGWQITASIPALATSAFQQRQPIVVLLDTRVPDLTALSRLLHTLPSSDDVLFVALAERWPTEKRRRSLSQADLVHIVLSSSTDTGLVELFARLAARCRAMPALFAVLEEADQPVEISDDDRCIQFVNRAYEAITGCTRAEILGTESSDSRRRSLHSRIAVIAESDGTVIRRVSNDWQCITVPSSSYSSQYVYVKRGSSDAFMCRDMSLKSVRSQNALVDAPISEVLSLLREALTRSEGDTQQLVKDAVRVLTSTELYAPSITRFSRDTDRIASGYYDGLIKLHHPSRQRKRSVVDAYRDKRSSAAGLGGGAVSGARRVSTDLKLALANDTAWNFDVLNLERLTEQHALVVLGQKIFDRWKVAEALGCTSDCLGRWLTAIEAHYHPENPYHNATHAADVLQGTAYFLESRRVGEVVQDTHAIAALLAATVHDLDHPGRGNAFLINTKHSLALLYNDQSVLENHHVALAFQLTVATPAINIFAAMPREEYGAMRQAIVDMVLATDMSRHFEYLTRFQQTLSNIHETDDEKDTSMTVCRMLIKCADIGNPAREFELCQKWAYKIVEEYFDQTAEEREKNLPLTMELFDRTTCNVPLTQCGFIDMFAREMFSTWCEFAQQSQLLVQLEANYDCWKEQTASWTPARNLLVIGHHNHGQHH